MIKGKGKLDSKKDLWNFALVRKILMQNQFLDKHPKEPQATTTSKPFKQFVAKIPHSAIDLKEKLQRPLNYL